MSAPPPVEPPDDELAQYIAAFREVERPSAASEEQTWAAITSRTRSARLVWLGAGLLAAAAVIAVFVRLGPGWMSEASRSEDASLAPYEKGSDELRPSPELKAIPRRAPTPKATLPEPESTPKPASESADAEPTPPKPTRKRNAGTGGATGGSDLAAETELFREIQLALANGRGAVALRLVAEHERDFPRGSFRLEREVLRARALCRLGRRAEARQAAEAFVKKHPRSSLASRMKKICVDEKTITDPK